MQKMTAMVSWFKKLAENVGIKARNPVFQIQKVELQKECAMPGSRGDHESHSEEGLKSKLGHYE